MDKPKFYCADVYNKVYVFHKKWAGAKGTSDDWEHIVDEADATIKSLGGGFARNLVMSVLQELETHIHGGMDSNIAFSEYYIKLLKIYFKVKTNKELAEKIMEMETG